MTDNLNIFDFALDAADLAAIAQLETVTSSFFSHREHRDPAIVKWMSERLLDIRAPPGVYIQSLFSTFIFL